MKKNKRQYKYLLPILFFIIILAPILLDISGVNEFERKNENRVFHDSIHFNINNLDALPKEIENYFNDNFYLRTPLLEIYNKLKFYVFKVSPYPEKTIIGKDNWFFMSQKEMDMFYGKKNFSKLELQNFLHEWSYRKKYLDSMGIKCYWLIPPIKQDLYPEMLPFYQEGSQKNVRVSQLIETFKDSLSDLIIDVLPILVDKKSESKLFYKLDNHWNLKCGYLASEEVFKRMKLDFPDLKESYLPKYDWADSVVQAGFHYNVLGIDKLYDTDFYPIIKTELSTRVKKYGFVCPEGFPYKWNYEIRYVNKQANNKLRVLVIRDSFGHQLIPFLKEVFCESVFIFDSWKYNLDKNIIETVKPDVIIYVSSVKLIENIIDE